MKKTALAALGVAGACAACCAIPIALPLVGGLSVVGLTGLGTSLFLADHGWLLAAGVLGLAGVVGVLVWRRLRPKPSACARSACGCAPG